jgi:predicted transcriptional regulator
MLSFTSYTQEVWPVNRRIRRYRGRIEISANILEIAKSGSRKTKIMYLGNLSFDLTQKYLKQLVGLQLIDVKESDGDKIYSITPKGEKFLADFYELQKHDEIAENKRRTLEGTLKATP